MSFQLLLSSRCLFSADDCECRLSVYVFVHLYKSVVCVFFISWCSRNIVLMNASYDWLAELVLFNLIYIYLYANIQSFSNYYNVAKENFSCGRKCSWSELAMSILMMSLTMKSELHVHNHCHQQCVVLLLIFIRDDYYFIISLYMKYS